MQKGERKAYLRKYELTILYGLTSLLSSGLIIGHSETAGCGDCASFSCIGHPGGGVPVIL